MVQCSSCKAPIVWCRWFGKTRFCPVDVEPVPNGNIAMIDIGLIRYYTADDEKAGRARYVSHFATCPNSAEHRRQAREKEASAQAALPFPAPPVAGKKRGRK